MYFTPGFRWTAAIVSTTLLCLVLGVILGCAAMQELDRQIAQAVAPPDQAVTTQPGPTVKTRADPPTPFVEISAGILALFGYGGLAAYIRSTKKNGSNALRVLQGRVAYLEKSEDEKTSLRNKKRLDNST